MKLSSFQRQLNLYGFKKIFRGEDKDCYFHPLFQREHKDLLSQLRRSSKDVKSFHDFLTEKNPQLLQQESMSTKHKKSVKFQLSASPLQRIDPFIRCQLPPSPIHSRSANFMFYPGLFQQQAPFPVHYYPPVPYFYYCPVNAYSVPFDRDSLTSESEDSL